MSDNQNKKNKHSLLEMNAIIASSQFFLKYLIVISRSQHMPPNFQNIGLLCGIGPQTRKSLLLRGGFRLKLILCLFSSERHFFHRNKMSLMRSVISNGNKFSEPKCVATLEEHSSYVHSVAFHPTAPLLATGSADETVKLWR